MKPLPKAIRPATKAPVPPSAPSNAVTALVLDLEKHRAELEAQNEELRRTQAALAASHDLYRDLYERAPVGYLSLDRRGHVKQANPCAATLLGVESSQLLGTSLYSCLSEDNADELFRYLERLRADNAEPGDLVLKVGARWISLRVDLAALIASEGLQAAPGSKIVLSDVTERKRREAELRESEARFRQIAEHVADVFLISERQSGRVLYASPAMERICGHSPQELYARPAAGLSWVHDEDREGILRAYDNMLKGDPLDEVLRIRRPSGEIRWVRGRIFPIEEAGGQVHRDVAVIQDITSERELEEELRQAQKMEAVGVLASGIAHDFNNVLQAVMGYINMARGDEAMGTRARQALEEAASAAHRGGELSTQLMAFARKGSTDREPIHIDRVVDKVSRLLDRVLTEQIILQVETRAPESVIVAAATQIEQLLLNLAANARDAMPDGGTLSIRTKALTLTQSKAHLKAGHYVQLMVEDTGIGMDEAMRKRIFEPFFTTKDVGEGTGLGLATVFAITEALGGHMDVSSEKGKWTSFSFLFPCHEEAIAQPKAGAPSKQLSGSVLLVEDERLVRLTVRYYLQELGLDVEEAAAAEEARELCERRGSHFDLLISDVLMAGMSGPRLAADLKQRYPDLRVLFISANPDIHAVKGGDRVGGAPLLRKPFGKEELAAKLGELLRPKGPEPASEFAVRAR